MPWNSHEHRHRWGQGSHRDGPGDALRRRRRTVGLFGRPDSQETVRDRQQPDGRDDRVKDTFRYRHTDATMANLDFDLYLITDRHQTGGRSLTWVVEEALRAGAKAVQLREKDLPARPLLDLAYELRKRTSAYGARLLINDRVDLCLAVEADGVHLRSDRLPTERVRSLLGPDKLIGVSAHSVPEARKAQREGADFIVLGPIYFTASKAAYGSPLGPVALRDARQAGITLPIFAIGGITPGRIQEIRLAGADGAAVISAVLAVENVQQAVKNFFSRLAAAGSP